MKHLKVQHVIFTCIPLYSRDSPSLCLYETTGKEITESSLKNMVAYSLLTVTTTY